MTHAVLTSWEGIAHANWPQLARSLASLSTELCTRDFHSALSGTRSSPKITAWNGAGGTQPVVNAYSYNSRRLMNGQGDSVSQPGCYARGLGYGYDRNDNPVQIEDHVSGLPTSQHRTSTYAGSLQDHHQRRRCDEQLNNEIRQTSI